MGSDFAESRLENDLHTLISVDPAIKSFAVQSHQLIYWAPDDSGLRLKRTYTPDVVALGSDQLIRVIEVKAAYFANQGRWRRLEPYIREAYETDHGVSFHVFTESEIRQQPRLSNAQIMYSHRPPPCDDEAALILRQFVDAVRVTTLGELYVRSAKIGIDERRVFSAVMRLGISGAAKLDLSKPFHDGTSVMRGS